MSTPCDNAQQRGFACVIGLDQSDQTVGLVDEAGQGIKIRARFAGKAGGDGGLELRLPLIGDNAHLCLYAGVTRQK